MNAALPVLRKATFVETIERAIALLNDANQDIATAVDRVAFGAAFEAFARSKKLGSDAIRISQSFTLQAERNLGQLLREMPKNEGTRRQLKGRDSSGGSKTEPPEKDTPTLAKLGIDKKESMEAQQLAALPEKKFNEVLEGKTTAKKAIAEARGSKPKAEKPAAKPKKATPEPDPEAEEFAPNAAEEWDREHQEHLKLQDENKRIKEENASLAASDSGKEIARLLGKVDSWKLKFDQLMGRLEQCNTTRAEAEKQAKYATGLLAQIRKALKVEKNSEILPALK